MLPHAMSVKRGRGRGCRRRLTFRRWLHAPWRSPGARPVLLSMFTRTESRGSLMRDFVVTLVELTGFAMVFLGVAMLSVPASLIVAGVSVLGMSAWRGHL